MSDISGAGGSDQIRVDINFRTQNLPSVLKEIHRLKADLQSVSQASTQKISGKTGIAAQTAEYQRLTKAVQQASKASQAYGKAQMLGVKKPTDDSRKALAAFTKDIKAFKKAQYDAGTAIVGQPKSWS